MTARASRDARLLEMRCSSGNMSEESIQPTNTYTVRTEAFEGPLDLLLSLIEKRKLHINDVALSTVTDEFITYIQEQHAFPVSQAAHFIYVASTLLLIKSKSLLPTLELTETEEADVADLTHRLQLYKKFKPLAAHIRRLYGATPMYGKRPAPKEPVFAPDALTHTEALAAAGHDVVTNLPAFHTHTETTVAHIVSVEEMVDRLAQRVQHELSTHFSAIASATADRAEIVTSFLALLELIKRGVVAVRQTEQFGDIAIETQDVTVPDYGGENEEGTA